MDLHEISFDPLMTWRSALRVVRHHRTDHRTVRSFSFLTPHGLFKSLVPTRRVLALELWANGRVTSAISDEYLGNATALGTADRGGEPSYFEGVLKELDVGGVLIIERRGGGGQANETQAASFKELVAGSCATHELPLALWQSDSGADYCAAYSAVRAAAVYGTVAGDFSSLRDKAPDNWELLDAMDGDAWDAFLVQGRTSPLPPPPPQEILTGLALSRFIGDVVGGWSNTFG